MLFTGPPSTLNANKDNSRVMLKEFFRTFNIIILIHMDNLFKVVNARITGGSAALTHGHAC